MNPAFSPSPAGFPALGIAPGLLAILAQKQITTPTPIQHQAIPPAIEGKDIVGIAQTGTGKTWAFGIPLLQNIAAHGGRALVLVPTRELAAQVEEALAPFAAALHIGTAVFVGGASYHRQREMLRRDPRVLIATPGRLNDHLEQGTVTLREVSVLVLDEADRMLDMGFLPQIERILLHVPRERQTMLFSATMPRDILRLAAAHMASPLRVEVAPSGTAAENVEQELFLVRREEKMRLLESLLGEYAGAVLLFSRTKHGARKIARAVNGMGHAAAEIHANRSLHQRREALEGFKSGKYRVLVATNIAARGIDVSGIEVVINFDLPDDPADYVHRVGRTARAGRAGRAITFATHDEAGEIRSIERLTRKPIRRRPLPVLPPPRNPVQPSSAEAPRAFERRRPHSGAGRRHPFRSRRRFGEGKRGFGRR